MRARRGFDLRAELTPGRRRSRCRAGQPATIEPGAAAPELMRAGRRLVSALPNARLVVLEGCHHLPQHEQPAKLLKVLGTFLEK